MILGHGFKGESGAALLLALMILSILTLLGLFMSLNATTGTRISDNYESELQATYAALSGLNHARVLIRGLALDDLLAGPDGAYDPGAAYRAEARNFRFRMPMPLSMLHTLDIVDPVSDVSGLPDDGIINTGKYEGVPGIELIPKSGIGQMSPDPYGSGSILTSRYFVKATDNNGEASEVAGDPGDNPFVDGDGIIIVRSAGVARTLSEPVGSITAKNSVVIYEARFKRLSTWNIGPALVTIAPRIEAEFYGMFEITGETFPGIGTIDSNSGDTLFPDQILRTAAAGIGSISGAGLSSPSIQDVTGWIAATPDQLQLLVPGYLWQFVHSQAPRMADTTFDGSQNWDGGSSPYLGTYDPAKPANAPDQDPKITVVSGDLHVGGGISGGGLLIVTGKFSCSGPFIYSGLILVIGSGNIELNGLGSVIEGGVFSASLTETGGSIDFGTPRIVISGNARIASNPDVVRMASGLIPPLQLSFREIAGSDP